MKRLRVDLSGRTFGRLSVIRFHSRINGKAHWLCRCSCAVESVVQGYNLTSGHTTSCGCKVFEAPASVVRHGMTGTRVHEIWRGMLARCLNPNEQAFPNYGGRGIVVCERWLTFENFYDDMGDPPPGTSLDRVDNNRGYGPDNCRWATPKQQGRNKRNNRLVTRHGETMPMAAWIEHLGLNATTVYERQRRGWPENHLLDPPDRGKRLF